MPRLQCTLAGKTANVVYYGGTSTKPDGSAVSGVSYRYCETDKCNDPASFSSSAASAATVGAAALAVVGTLAAAFM